MEILVKFTEDNENKSITFYSYEGLGLWISNNYESITIDDVIVSEE